MSTPIDPSRLRTGDRILDGYGDLRQIAADPQTTADGRTELVTTGMSGEFGAVPRHHLIERGHPVQVTSLSADT